MVKNNMDLSLRKRKIRDIQEQQRKLRGIPMRKTASTSGHASFSNLRKRGGSLETNNGITNIKIIANKTMKIKPKKIVEIIKESNPIRKEKRNQSREQTSNLKKLPPGKLNKRIFY